MAKIAEMGEKIARPLPEVISRLRTVLWKASVKSATSSWIHCLQKNTKRWKKQRSACPAKNHSRVRQYFVKREEIAYE